MKTILIISYEYPPLNSVGAKRWGEMSKYLRQYFNIYVFTIKSIGDLPVHLPEQNIIRVGATLDRIKSLNTEENFKVYRYICNAISSMTTKRLVTIDKTILSWYTKHRKRFLALLKKVKPDIVISSSTPFSAHLFGYLAKCLNKEIIWIADIRDPVSLTEVGTKYLWEKLIDKVIDRFFIRKADLITTVSKTCKELLTNLYRTKNVAVIYNGFMYAPNEDINTVSYIPKNRILMYFAGSMLKVRIDSFKLLCESIKGMEGVIFKVRFLTSMDKINKLRYEVQKVNNANVIILPPTGYMQVQQEEYEADILVSLHDLKYQHPVSKGAISVTLLEYLPKKAPILAIGRKHPDLAEVLAKTERGMIASTREEILYFIKNREKFAFKDYNKIKEYSREYQAHKVVDLINNLLCRFK